MPGYIIGHLSSNGTYIVGTIMKATLHDYLGITAAKKTIGKTCIRHPRLHTMFTNIDALRALNIFYVVY